MAATQEMNSPVSRGGEFGPARLNGDGTNGLSLEFPPNPILKDARYANLPRTTVTTGSSEPRRNQINWVGVAKGALILGAMAGAERVLAPATFGYARLSDPNSQLSDGQGRTYLPRRTFLNANRDMLLAGAVMPSVDSTQQTRPEEPPVNIEHDINMNRTVVRNIGLNPKSEQTWPNETTSPHARALLSHLQRELASQNRDLDHESADYVSFDDEQGVSSEFALVSMGQNRVQYPANISSDAEKVDNVTPTPTLIDIDQEIYLMAVQNLDGQAAHTVVVMSKLPDIEGLLSKDGYAAYALSLALPGSYDIHNLNNISRVRADFTRNIMTISQEGNKQEMTVSIANPFNMASRRFRWDNPNNRNLNTFQEAGDGFDLDALFDAFLGGQLIEPDQAYPTPFVPISSPTAPATETVSPPASTPIPSITPEAIEVLTKVAIMATPVATSPIEADQPAVSEELKRKLKIIKDVGKYDFGDGSFEATKNGIAIPSSGKNGFTEKSHITATLLREVIDALVDRYPEEMRKFQLEAPVAAIVDDTQRLNSINFISSTGIAGLNYYVRFNNDGLVEFGPKGGYIGKALEWFGHEAGRVASRVNTGDWWDKNTWWDFERRFHDLFVRLEGTILSKADIEGANYWYNVAESLPG